MSLRCRVADCLAPARLICERCTELFCGPHYGESAARCGPCFRLIIAEQGVVDVLVPMVATYPDNRWQQEEF